MSIALKMLTKGMYYHKLLHYYRDGVVDDQEEQAIKIMQKFLIFQ